MQFAQCDSDNWSDAARILAAAELGSSDALANYAFK